MRQIIEFWVQGMKKIFFAALLSSLFSFSTNTQNHSALDKSDFGFLAVNWVGVIDNGEGDNSPHGPLGSLHILIYEGRYCPGSRQDYPTPRKKVYLNGPSSFEWKDGDALQMNLCLIKWESENDAVSVVVYESDPGRIGRSHDEIFCVYVRRQDVMDGQVVGDYYRLANMDAISNCRSREITWHEHVWSNGLSYGIPKMFMQFQTTSNCLDEKYYNKCPGCKGTGWVSKEWSDVKCPSCGGTGKAN